MHTTTLGLFAEVCVCVCVCVCVGVPIAFHLGWPQTKILLMTTFTPGNTGVSHCAQPL
jgi:hypothetical protein